MKKILLFISIVLIVLAIIQQTPLAGKLHLNKYLPSTQVTSPQNNTKQVVVYEESVITQVVANSLPSVVTVGINKTTSAQDRYEINPFDPFAPFRQVTGTQQKIEQNIGSGFIATKDGLIITNKHVVSDTTATYQILTNDNKKYTVDKIYRDPLNDLAILKISASNLKPLSLGNSSNLQLGQLVIAIGTPLGEFRNTVTHGIVSGLGRGITAGSPYEGYVEKLDNVIQTDAPISPGNSGGPLLNSKGEVIGINTAVAQEGQNIGFAIPANVINDLLTNFEKQGSSFERPYIGVRYKMLDQQTAVMNDLVAGAYVIEVIPNSPAAKVDIQVEDIITEIDGQKIKGGDDQEIAKSIVQKKVGDKITVKVWRNGQTVTKQITLEAAKD
ncbi:trypsin-like serine protease [Candidatus Roizmanbacteria bacterium]|nr:trypsin-like serine protease [Candidatus Roizmanbacteria bacterium]